MTTQEGYTAKQRERWAHYVTLAEDAGYRAARAQTIEEAKRHRRTEQRNQLLARRALLTQGN